MNARRLRPADWLTAIAGLALLLLLWAPWYEVRDGTLNAWAALRIADLWLALTALLALAVGIVTAARDSPSLPVAMNILTTTAAFLAALMVLVRLLEVPHDEVVTGRAWGLLAGAVATGAVLGGAYWAMRDERAPHMRPHPPIRRMQPPPEARAVPPAAGPRTPST